MWGWGNMGNEFTDLFDQWADSYDQTISGSDLEYKDVFLHYDTILENVADRSFGNVLEFGLGTGNLTHKLLNRNFFVIGVEPSSEMRKMANKKLNHKVQIVEGDFFRFPQNVPFQTIVSTYAFHHLTDSEKAEAITLYNRILPSGGKIVFADTMYESNSTYQNAIKDAINKGYAHLAKDLQTEYYTTIPVLSSILKANHFDANFEQCNEFVWLMEATKK
jgi:putative AdoMet-dependent methyltransferase